MQENSKSLPPDYIDGAKVISWARSATEAFGFVLDTETDETIAIVGLAICKYADTEGYYRFSCDNKWETMQDGFYETVESAMAQLPQQYDTAGIHWEQKSGEELISTEMPDYSNKIRAALFGVAVADALGVPVEFCKRDAVKAKALTGMIGYGTHHVPAGTFSDDSSLTFCLAEALTQEFSLSTISQKFVDWYYKNYWTATGTVFDIGNATRDAIERLVKGVRPDLAGGLDASSNGNGSLMRILPLAFYLMDKPIEERYQITKQVSSITHGHIRSVIACFYYLEFARGLLEQKDKFAIYLNLQSAISNHLAGLSINPAEIALFDRLLKQQIYEINEESIYSGGYVIHTLEASIWCLLTTDNYKDAVLKAVNLGDDTDTTAAVTGGLAGLLYGIDNIPAEWLHELARRDDIEALCSRMVSKLTSH